MGTTGGVHGQRQGRADTPVPSPHPGAIHTVGESGSRRRLQAHTHTHSQGDSFDSFDFQRS